MIRAAIFLQDRRHRVGEQRGSSTFKPMNDLVCVCVCVGGESPPLHLSLNPAHFLPPLPPALGVLPWQRGYRLQPLSWKRKKVHSDMSSDFSAAACSSLWWVFFFVIGMCSSFFHFASTRLNTRSFIFSLQVSILVSNYLSFHSLVKPSLLTFVFSCIPWHCSRH